jgi:hypothetical protein
MISIISDGLMSAMGGKRTLALELARKHILSFSQQTFYFGIGSILPFKAASVVLDVATVKGSQCVSNLTLSRRKSVGKDFAFPVITASPPFDERRDVRRRALDPCADVARR